MIEKSKVDLSQSALSERLMDKVIERYQDAGQRLLGRQIVSMALGELRDVVALAAQADQHERGERDARRDLAESRRREALFQNPTDPHRVGLDIDGVRVEGDPKSMEEVQRWRREASFYCDKAEDRLYHAVDKTWWRREQGGPMKGHLVQGSEPPACFYELARALVLNFGGLLHETSYAEASDREGPENAVLRRIVDDVTRLGMTLPEMKFAYEADNAVVLDSFPETLTTKSLDEIMAG